MKIGIVHLNLTYEGADARIVYTLAQTLKSMGHWVVIYAAEFDPTTYPKLHRGLDIRVARMATPLASTISTHGFAGKIKERFRRYLLYVGMVERIAHALEPDFHLVICHNDYSYQIARSYKKINPEAKVVWTMNNLPFYALVMPQMAFPVNWVLRLNARWERFRLHRYLPFLDRIFVVDKKRGEIAEASGIKTEVLPVPINFKRFYAPARPLTAKHPVRVLAVGHLTPARRFEDAILGVSHLAEEGYSIELTIVCPDIWKNFEYRRFLESLVKDRDIRNSVKFYFDPIPESELKKIYRESQVFLLLDVAQLWSMSALEAMAAGNLLVASSATSISKVLRHAENALLVDSERPDQIADRLRLLISHPSAYRKIAKAGQKFVRDNMDWDRYAQAVLESAFERRAEQVPKEDYRIQIR